MAVPEPVLARRVNPADPAVAVPEEDLVALLQMVLTVLAAEAEARAGYKMVVLAARVS